MNVSLGNRPIFVLGAGATKAFAPNAPLVEDDYGLERLLDHFQGFPYAFEILENERHRRKDGKMNIEQLMTRLHGRMPYDSEDAIAQQTHLLSELMKEFRRRIALARVNGVHKEELMAFARLIVKNGVTCITFNYDDILDEPLWKIDNVHRQGPISKQGLRYWHPDGGYGFFVRPSEITVHEQDRYMDKTSMLLLKLHGSINWFARSGEKKPYSIDAIFHDQDWYPPQSKVLPEIDRELIDRHLESEPFLVPPVLDKTVLGNEPILKTIWQLAKERLESADRIFFVGYSMPMTDLAASFLFAETLGRRVHLIHVINVAEEQDQRDLIKASYGKVFPNIKHNQFEFDGALAWVRRICGVETASGA